MNKEYNLKIEDIITDYYSAIAKFENVSLLIKNKEYYRVNPKDDKETKILKESRKNEILVDLGRVGELAFKYIIKLKQIEIYPNQSYEQFKKEALFNKGAIKNLANKMKLTEEEIYPLINYQDINRQEKHNFHYLFLIIEKLIPEIFKKFNQTITYNLLSKYYKEYNEEEYNEGIIFPFLSPLDIYGHDKDIKEINIVRENAIKHSGDIFTRLRYFSNNPKDKEFNVGSIYEIIKDMITFIKMIHNNKDVLNLNVEKEFAKIKIKENPEIIPKTKEDIVKLFSIDKIKDNLEAQQLVLFYSDDYRLNEIIEIFESPIIKTTDYVDIFCHSLKLDAIKYFKDIGINDYSDMVTELERPQKTNFSTSNTLEAYKKLRKFLESGNFNTFKLTNYLSINSIKKLNSYPKLLEFLLNTFYPNESSINFTKSFSYEDYIFNEILSIPNIEEKCELLYGLDIDQLDIFNYIIGLIKHNPKYKEVVPEKISINKIKENVIKNYVFMKDNSLFKNIYPLFLNPINNQKNIKLLISNGFNKTISNLDSTILCIPYYINEEIFKRMKKNGLNIFMNTDINNEYYNYLDKILIESAGISHRKIIKRNRQDYFKIKKIETGELDIESESHKSAFEKRLKLFIENKLNNC